MYKLTIRMHAAPAVAVAVVCIGAIVACMLSPNAIAAGMVEVPIVAVLAVVLLCAILVPLLAFKPASGAQKLRIGISLLAFSFLYGAIAARLFRSIIIMDLMKNYIHLVDIATMTVGAVASVFALYKLVSEENFATRAHHQATTDAPVQQSPLTVDDKAAVSTPEVKSATKSTAQGIRGAASSSKSDMPQQQKPSSSATNLMGLLDTLAPEIDETGDKLKAHPAKNASVKPVNSKTDLAAATSKPSVSSSSATPPAEQATVVEKVQPPITSATNLEAAKAEANKTPGQSGTNLPEQKKPATSTATRLQAQKRKSTNTYIKLQALSASGTGSTPAPRKTEENDTGDSLKSMLDRLDKTFEEPSLTEEVAMDNLFSQESLLTEPAHTPIPVAPQPASAAAKPAATTAPSAVSPQASAAGTSTEPPSLSAMLDSLDTATSGGAAGLGASKFGSMSNANRMANPLAQHKPGTTPAKPTTPTPPNPTPTPTPATPKPPVTPAAQTPAKPATPAVPATPAKPVATSPATPPTPAKPAATPTAKPVDAPKPGSKPPTPANFAKPSTSPAKPEAKPQPKPDQAKAEATPPAKPSEAKSAEKPLESKPESPKPTFQRSESARLDLKNLQPPADKTPSTVPKAEAKPDAKAADNLLGKVDREIDDIFSHLVPPEAQKEVKKDSPAEAASPPKPTTSSTPTAPVKKPIDKPIDKPVDKPVDKPAAKSKDNLFETGLDQEIDDIFSSLVPIEAQKEVEHRDGNLFEPGSDSSMEGEPPDVVAAPAAETTTKEEPKEPGLFEESVVDKELDDIFSNLAPVEAQRNVNKDTLSKIKAIDPADLLTAKEPIKDEPISFAPPNEEESSKDELATRVEPEPVRELTNEERLLQQLGSGGKFNETLASLPSMQGTIEGLLNNLAASESAQEESFAPPENEQFSPKSEADEPVAGRVMDLLESLESGTDEPAEKPKVEEPKKVVEPEIERPSLTGDVVDDLFGESEAAMESRKREQELATEATSEAAESIHSGVAEEIDAMVARANDSMSPKSEAKEESAQAKEPAEAEEAEAGPEPKPVDAEEAAAEAKEPEPEATPEAKEPEEAEAAAEAKETEAEAASEAKEPEEVEAAPEAKELEEAAAAAEAKEEPEKAEAAPEAKESEAAETAPAAAEATPEEVEAARAKAQLKEFGRLSAKPAGATTPSPETAGTMKTIGKLLIEVSAVENIIKAGESGTIGSGLTTARVISAQRGEGIKALLTKIDTFDGVRGSVIVGHDGLVIASTLPSDMDKDTLGVLSVACVSTSNLATKKLEIGKLRQMVMLTDKSLSVLTDVDVGILGVFLVDNDVTRVDGVLNAIHNTIHG